MSIFSYKQKYKPRRSRAKIISAILIVVIAISSFGVYWYSGSIVPLNMSDEQVKITVEDGMTDAHVAALLHSKQLIRSALAYELYARVNGKAGKMQAGSYILNSKQSVAEIVDQLSSGRVLVEQITILPAQRLDQIRQAFIDGGFTKAEVDAALNPSQYADHPALRDKPPLASLEGYLYPETFQKSDKTSLKTIIEASLDQTGKLLTAEASQKLSSNNLTLHEAVIIASIIEKEVSNLEDKPKVAQVFLKRLREDMPLGSDVTAYYGAIVNGLEPAVTVDTAFNTRIYKGLPPGPISNISDSSFAAVLNPAEGDYLFFVAGDDGVTYFSRTVEEHEALAAQHCIELCKLP